MSMVVTTNDEQQQDCGAAGSEVPEHPTEAQIAIDNFWPKMMEDVKKIKMIEPGNQILPLARIKKIMKLDEEVKMISAEAPLLFAKACEIFIHELTLRAWLHTDDNKRRTLQRNDIAMAISKYDQFDFLIDIVPRDEIKPKKENETTKTTVETPTVQYCFQQIGGDPSTMTAATLNPIMNPPQAATVVQAGNQLISSPMLIPLQQGQAGLQAQLGINGLISAAGQQIQGAIPQQLHFLQQVIGPNGEITQIPVPLNQNQLNFIRAQMQLSNPQISQQTANTNQQQQTNSSQPIIITQAANQQFPQTQILSPTQLTQPNQITFLNATQAQALQQNLQQQQQQQQQQHQQNHPQIQQIQIQQNHQPQGSAGQQQQNQQQQIITNQSATNN
uniref:Nuclear transcription factor Y subunit gamma n=1 Tax=Culicoides sonorensis TaxID=179676 RepID=A0A336M2B6_CULSO